MQIKSKKLVLSILGLLVLLNVVAFSYLVYFKKNNGLRVVFFDVGQGDSIFIETQQNNQILIDGGPDSGVLEKLGKEMPFFDRKIELVVLTHTDKDHLSGLLEVLKSYQVENILWSGVLTDSAQYEEWKELIYEEGANIKIAEFKNIIKWDKDPKHYIEVLNPTESIEDKEIKYSNDGSVVLRLVFENNSFLFPGDISYKTEEELIKKEVLLDSDVLKISHHGSKNSSSEKFISEVSPEIGIISVGKENSYGHPDPQTLEKLEKYGIKILRTDKEGDIIIFSNGKKIKIIN